MKKQNKFIQLLLYTIAIIISLAMIFPFIWMISSSFKPTKEILSSTLRLIPQNFTLNAYREIADLGGLTIWRCIGNSFFIVGTSVILTVFITSLGAYALIRKPYLPGFKLVEKFFLVSIMYPYILLVMPVYIIIFQLGLLGSYTGIIIFLCLGPIQFFLFREFFTKIPREVIESAQVDGASEFQIFFKIVMPMARPVFMTVILLTFILNWDNWFPVLVISTTMDTYTLPVALFTLDSQLEVNFPEIMALSTVVSLPVIAMFIATQRKVMEGFAAGSLKG
jgi:ABC-type glycerol-3-phosphate transport system permease component